MNKRIWATGAIVLAGCGSGDPTIFVGVTSGGPGTVEVKFNEQTVLDGQESPEWNADRVTSVFSGAQDARPCVQSGRAGICVRLNDEDAAMTVSFVGQPRALPRAELEGFARATADAVNECMISAFDSTRLDCGVEGGQAMFVDVTFRSVVDVNALTVRVEGARSTVEAAVDAQPVLRVEPSQPVARGGGRSGARTLFRARAGDGEVFVGWRGDCRGRPESFERTLDRNLSCTAVFRTANIRRSGLCGENERVENGACVSCDTNHSKLAGDDPGGTDTECLQPACAADHRVEDGVCVSCTADETNLAGDNPQGGSTTCDGARCPSDHRVEAAACTPCEEGQFNEAGDDPTGGNTTCVDAASNPFWAPPAENPVQPPATCAENNGGCDPNARCDDAAATLTCACLDLFVGDGRTCRPIEILSPQTVSVPAACSARGPHDFRWELRSRLAAAPQRIGSAVWVPGFSGWNESQFNGARVFDPTAAWIDCTPVVEGGSVAGIRGDGAGGWFVFGTFAAIDGQSCPALARLDAQLQVDPAFCRALPAELTGGGFTDGQMQIDGSVVYVMGGGGPTGSRLFAIDLSSNTRLFDAPLVFMGDNGPSITVGDDYILTTGLGSAPMTSLAAFDKVTGAASPNPFPVFGGGFESLLASAVGATALGYLPDRGEIRAWDLATGVERPWRLTVQGIGRLSRLHGRFWVRAAVVDGQPLGSDAYFEVLPDGSLARWTYGDPSITSVEIPDLGVTDNGVVRVTLDDTSRTINPTGPVFDVPVLAGRSAISGGVLAAIDNPRASFPAGAVWDLTTGAVEPLAIAQNGATQALTVTPVAAADGPVIGVWGDFTMIEGASRNGFALLRLGSAGLEVLAFEHPSVPRPTPQHAYTYWQDQLFVRDDTETRGTHTFVDEYRPDGSTVALGLRQDFGRFRALAITARGLIVHDTRYNTRPNERFVILELVRSGNASNWELRPWRSTLPNAPLRYLGSAAGRVFFGPTMTVFDGRSTEVVNVSLPFDRDLSQLDGMVVDDGVAYFFGPYIEVAGERRSVVAVDARTLRLLDWNPIEASTAVQSVTILSGRLVLMPASGIPRVVDKARR